MVEEGGVLVDTIVREPSWDLLRYVGNKMNVGICTRIYLLYFIYSLLGSVSCATWKRNPSTKSLRTGLDGDDGVSRIHHEPTRPPNRPWE